jgi:signal peptidase I
MCDRHLLKSYVYKGRSMHGTFRTGDLLLVASNCLKDIQIGDVVVFKAAELDGADKLVVHRVINQTSQGLITQGDGNTSIDTGCVNEINLIGSVQFSQRGSKVYRVRGGLLGQLRKKLLHYKQGVNFLTEFCYRCIKRFVIFGYMWKLVVRRVEIHTSDGPLLKYTIRNRTVAQWRPTNDEFCYERFCDVILRFFKDCILYYI